MGRKRQWIRPCWIRYKRLEKRSGVFRVGILCVEPDASSRSRLLAQLTQINLPHVGPMRPCMPGTFHDYQIEFGDPRW